MRENMLVYRLEDKKDELPCHWSYQDAWELSEEGYTDNRQAGFQVWSELHRVVAVTAGEATADGNYDAKDYPFFCVIEASDIYDGADEWFAVRCEAVKSVKGVETLRLIDWARSKWAVDVENGYHLYEDDFEAWCKDFEEEISDWLLQNAVLVSHKFVETLENPYLAA